jgi:hypothetical protein
MPTQNQLPWSHSNRYSADSACLHCEGVIRHESWCPVQNASVLYAYRTVSEPDLLSLGDQLILHALGVTWTAAKLRPKLRGLTHEGLSAQHKRTGT